LLAISIFPDLKYIDYFYVTMIGKKKDPFLAKMVHFIKLLIYCGEKCLKVDLFA